MANTKLTKEETEALALLQQTAIGSKYLKDSAVLTAEWAILLLATMDDLNKENLYYNAYNTKKGYYFDATNTAKLDRMVRPFLLDAAGAWMALTQVEIGKNLNQSAKVHDKFIKEIRTLAGDEAVDIAAGGTFGGVPLS